MNDIADWSQKLRTNRELTEALDLTWLDEGEQNFIREDWLAAWNDVPFDEAFHADCRARLDRCIPLAQGLARSRKLTHTTSRLTLFADPLEPDVIFASLSHAMPSLIWTRSAPAADALLAALAPYLCDEKKSVGEFSRVVRVAKVPGVQDRGPIEQSVEYLELWLDDAFWYSGFADDPWQDHQGQLNMLQQSAWLRDVTQEHPGRFPSVSWRSLWSKSVLRVEQHLLGIYVFELRYEPANDAKAIELVNEVTGGHLPLDMPTDLAASLLRGGVIDEITLDDMQARGEPLRDRLALQCALAPGETTTYAALRRAATDHPDDETTLSDIVDIAAEYGHRSLWFHIVADNEGSPLAEELRTYLSPQAGPEAR